MKEELNELFSQLIAESPLSEPDKQKWMDTVRDQGPSADLLTKLQGEINAAVEKEQTELSDELVHIAGEANEIEHQFQSQFAAATAEEKVSARQQQQEHDRTLLEKLRQKLNG